MTKRKGPPAFEAFDERLDKLRRGPGTSTDSDVAPGGPPGMRASDGFRAGVEVIGGVAGGALIGFGLDSWLGTTPACMIGFFFLGAAAGVLNAYRTLRRFMSHDPPPAGS